MGMNIGASRDPQDGDPDVMVEMNTTPLIDVMLVLLVMLIITIPIQLHSVNLEMPSVNAAPPQNEPVIVRITMAPGGVVLWNGEPVADQASLTQRLTAEAAKPEQPEIHLRPDRGARYDAVAAVLASVQRLGLVKVGIVGSEQFVP